MPSKIATIMPLDGHPRKLKLRKLSQEFILIKTRLFYGFACSV